VCSGTNDGSSRSGSGAENFVRMKEMYTNCTYVFGNVEISTHDWPADANLDFLGKIREVNGYVRLLGMLPPNVKELPFKSLRIIRGDTLYNHNGGEYSLLIANTQTRSLDLDSLRGKLVVNPQLQVSR